MSPACPLAEDRNLITIFPEGRLRRDAKSQRNSYLTVNASLKPSFIDGPRVLIESRSEINRLYELVEPALCDLWSREFWGLAIVCSGSWFSQAAEPESSPKVRNCHVAAEVNGNHARGGGTLGGKFELVHQPQHPDNHPRFGKFAQPPVAGGKRACLNLGYMRIFAERGIVLRKVRNGCRGGRPFRDCQERRRRLRLRQPQQRSQPRCSRFLAAFAISLAVGGALAMGKRVRLGPAPAPGSASEPFARQLGAPFQPFRAAVI